MKKVRLDFVVAQEIKEKLKKIAEAQHRSMASALVAMVTNEYKRMGL